jgi:exopolyphosphatase/guanosine-5'-triphosphate,3'-diphosphate pyrophosphatase
MASVTFKNKVVEEIQKKDIKKVSSPNPIKAPQVGKAMSLAEHSAIETVPQALQKKLPTAEVLGIGGVLTRSITKHIPGKSQITLQDLTAAIKTNAPRTDKELGGEFATTEVTNMILVAGYMKALGIQHYVPTEASLVDAIWSDETYW